MSARHLSTWVHALVGRKVFKTLNVTIILEAAGEPNEILPKVTW